MTSKEALETLGENIEYKDYSNKTIHLVNKCFAKIELDLERLETLETFITWLRGTTFRKTEEIDKIFKKLKEVLKDE